MTLMHFYPRSPCGERLWPGLLARPFFIISIHALLAESDTRSQPSKPRTLISIHALLAESDHFGFLRPSRVGKFLSTLSLRRATGAVLELQRILGRFLSTLSLRRATRIHAPSQHLCPRISIHALLAESDVSASAYYSPPPNFYPRSPCGERLTIMLYDTSSLMISIHALLAESDTDGSICFDSRELFLSTLSLRRATRVRQRNKLQYSNFYPRSPCGERPPEESGQRHSPDISIHALLAESDQEQRTEFSAQNYFYPRSPCGERLFKKV